ncbi:MAG TPA: DnaA regulatory inactivator Hda [Gammaproteobacteria bacterium]|nr:DnaA regulatory inactivator Hda [Gammaproteobacteria bacterium]
MSCAGAAAPGWSRTHVVDGAQLPLALEIADHARFDTFVVGAANDAAVEHVRAVAAGRADLLWLWGAPGSGKTHLLQAACRAAAAAERRAMYVPLAGLQPEILSGLDDMDLLALDGLDGVAGAADWERALFVLLNGIAERRGGLLLAARAPAPAAGFRLPDLASRAGGAVAYRLKPLDDDERLLALRGHAAARGLEIERAAAEYLLARVHRDMRDIGVWLERLDRISLAEQRKITIPFIRELLAAHGGGGE